MALCYPDINNHDNWHFFMENAPGFPLKDFGYAKTVRLATTDNAVANTVTTVLYSYVCESSCNTEGTSVFSAGCNVYLYV